MKDLSITLQFHFADELGGGVIKNAVRGLRIKTPESYLKDVLIYIKKKIQDIIWAHPETDGIIVAFR